MPFVTTTKFKTVFKKQKPTGHIGQRLPELFRRVYSIETFNRIYSDRFSKSSSIDLCLFDGGFLGSVKDFQCTAHKACVKHGCVIVEGIFVSYKVYYSVCLMLR